MKNETPLARFENIIVQELLDETLICDTTNNRMFCLNKTAAEIWKLADGTRNTEEISRLLSKKFKSKVGEEMISFALVELSKENLLIERIQMSADFQNLSRREVIRRVGLASMVALPLISSLAMPKAVHAASNCAITDFIGRVQDGCFCDDPNQCISLCCDTQNTFSCVPNEICNNTGGGDGTCEDNRNCDTNCCDNGVCADFSVCCANTPGCCIADSDCSPGSFCNTEENICCDNVNGCGI